MAIFNIDDCASFEDAMQDVFNEVDVQGIDTAVDKVCVYMEMNGGYSPNGAARVDVTIYVNESDFTIGTDVIAN